MTRKTSGLPENQTRVQEYESGLIIRMKFYERLEVNSINRVIALSDLKPDQQGRVVTIKTKTTQELLKLMGAGILPDARVNVMHRDKGHVLFFANYRELALDQEIASGIYVEPDR